MKQETGSINLLNPSPEGFGKVAASWEAEKLVYSIPEVADKLGICRNLAYKLVKENKIPGVIHLGRRTVISVATFKKFTEGS